MSAETIETRLAIVEYEARSTTERMDRELATKVDIADVKADIADVKADIATVRTEIQVSKNEMIRWMFALMLAQPVVWIGVIMAAQRLGLLAP